MLRWIFNISKRYKGIGVNKLKIFIIKDDAIKLSNIKTFGIGTGCVYEISVPIYERYKTVRDSRWFKKTLRGLGKFAWTLTAVATDTNLGNLDFMKTTLIFTNQYRKIKYSGTKQSHLNSKNATHAIIIDTLNNNNEYTLNHSKFNDYFIDKEKKPIYRHEKYLYITTFQNDNYRYYNNEIDVKKEFERLTSLMNK